MHLKQRHRFSWTRANRAGMTRMIVKSANDYPVSVLQRHGRASINHWVAAQGYYGHPFSAVRASRTTANSLVKVLKDLQLGQQAFNNRQDRAFILSLMKRQVYRRGIPTGVARADKGTVVRDKVGFLNDNNGDAGIVTLPNGQRYLLAILTWGRGQHGFSGYPRIARIAEHVQKIVY
ncbi:serine hydrolase [Levilactobacillus zymae]|uniref:Beta-lactamase class A n=1 Tax=Levilactobacillus zymae TaxID=267363 RepID=A0A1Y6JZM4_9LACO|nr:serine hydrolase [Levilactobacillus zymae]SMS14303.1 Beta-lactamase class A [Levilactobacillus zymae]